MTFSVSVRNIGNSSASVQKVAWTAGAAGDTGDAVDMVEWRDTMTVQVTGTFSSSTVTIEGSNDGTNFVTLNNLQGTALSFTAAGLKGVAEAPLYIRPKVTGGTGSDIAVTLVMRSFNFVSGL